MALGKRMADMKPGMGQAHMKALFTEGEVMAKKEVLVDNRVVTKVRWNGKVGRIVYTISNPNGVADKVNVEFHDAPDPAFQKCLDGLLEHALLICDLPKPWGLTAKVSGANYNAGCAQMCVTKIVPNGKPFNFNTPKTLIYADDDDEVEHLSDACAELLENLSIEAKKYLDGSRLQGSLFNQAG